MPKRSRGRALADDDVEPEVLQRRVQDLLDGGREAVDLVDEEHVAFLQAGQNRRHISFAFERRAGDGAEADAELLSDYVGETRLAESRGADQEQVVERLLPRAGRLQGDRELFL